MRWWLLLAVGSACATAPRAVDGPLEEKVAPAPVVAAQGKPWVRSSPPPALGPVPRSRPEVSTRTLKNGLKVVVVEDHRVRLVQTRLFLPSGSAADSDEQVGATWFALALLGDTFDERDQDERPLRPLEKSARYLTMMNGASLRFEVSADTSWIGIDGYAVDTASLLKRLDAVITERRHGADSFEARAQAVTDMINELELTDGAALDQYLSQLAFGAEHPYARPVFGTPASLAHLGLEDILERQRQLLTPVGSTLLVAGDVRADEVFSRVQQAFGDWKGIAEAPVVVRPPAVTKRRSVVFLPRSPSRNTLVCLTRPLGDVAGSSAAVSLAIAVLGQRRMSGVLREQSGFTYSVSSALVRRRAARALLICSRVRSTETTNATRLMLKELSSFGSAPPTPEELEPIRAMAITEAQIAQDELGGIVEAWRQAATMKLQAPPEGEVAELQAVTLAQVAAISKALSSSDTVQVIFSGERGLVDAAARANGLGPLKVPILGKVTE